MHGLARESVGGEGLNTKTNKKKQNNKVQFEFVNAICSSAFQICDFQIAVSCLLGQLLALVQFFLLHLPDKVQQRFCCSTFLNVCVTSFFQIKCSNKGKTLAQKFRSTCESPLQPWSSFLDINQCRCLFTYVQQNNTTDKTYSSRRDFARVPGSELKGPRLHLESDKNEMQ